MGEPELFWVLKLVPYVLGFLREQWRRTISQHWATTLATVTGGVVEGNSAPYMAELFYVYHVGASTFSGSLWRRCLLRSSADKVVQFPPGTPLSIRYNPRKPEVSYAPIPLSIDGFVVGALPVLALAGLFFLVGFGVVQQHHVEARDRIRDTEWQTLKIGRLFQVRVPGPPAVALASWTDMRVDGKEPSVMTWSVKHDNARFYIQVLEYPSGTVLSPQVFDRLLTAMKLGYANRMVRLDEPIRLGPTSGRRFKFTHPDTTMEVYVDGYRVYVLATTWHVESDNRIFFRSLKISQ